MSSTNRNKPVGLVVTEPHGFSSPLYHPSVQTVATDLTAIEKSVLECATVGCSSIWVCCTESMQPIVRKRLGDYVKDPTVMNKSNFTNFPEDNRINIPIYFYSPHPKDRKRRVGPAWDVLNACLAVYHFSFQFSRWLAPNKYYISFCYGLYDFTHLSKYRREFTQDVNFLLEHRGADIFSGALLGACLTGEFIKETIIHLKSTPLSYDTGGLDFTNLPRPPSFRSIKINEYFTCTSWLNYVEYIKNRNFEFNYDRKKFFNMNTNRIIT